VSAPHAFRGDRVARISFQLRFTRLRFVLLGAGALLSIALAILWWRITPPKDARATCERYVSLVLENKCSEAYELTTRTTYKFSTLDSFCQDNHPDAHTWNPSTVRCDEGEWQGANDYVVFGRLTRRNDTQAALFGMRLHRLAAKWLVVEFKFDD
jgi:hypothetical protein